MRYLSKEEVDDLLREQERRDKAPNIFYGILISAAIFYFGWHLILSGWIPEWVWIALISVIIALSVIIGVLLLIANK